MMSMTTPSPQAKEGKKMRIQTKIRSTLETRMRWSRNKGRKNSNRFWRKVTLTEGTWPMMMMMSSWRKQTKKTAAVQAIRKTLRAKRRRKRTSPSLWRRRRKGRTKGRAQDLPPPPNSTWTDLECRISSWWWTMKGSSGRWTQTWWTCTLEPSRWLPPISTCSPNKSWWVPSSSITKWLTPWPSCTSSRWMPLLSAHHLPMWTPSWWMVLPPTQWRWLWTL